MPALGRISENPLDRAALVVQGDDETFPTRDKQGVVGPVVSRGIAMEPIDRRRENKQRRIVSSRTHGSADDVGHVKCLEHVPGAVDFEKSRFDLSSRSNFQNQSGKVLSRLPDKLHYQRTSQPC